jgi:class 3 adenylate cyclase
MKRLTFKQQALATTEIALRDRFRTSSSPDLTSRRSHFTILFGDIVGSTQLLVTIGDLNWIDVVYRYYHIVRRESQFFDGRYLTTAGDGFFAAFDQTANGVACAFAILRGVKLLGLKIRFGIHAGECFDIEEQLVGLTVHVGARIAEAAEANEVLVSDSVKNLITDSRLHFLDRGMYSLKGVPGQCRLFAAS